MQIISKFCNVFPFLYAMFFHFYMQCFSIFLSVCIVYLSKHFLWGSWFLEIGMSYQSWNVSPWDANINQTQLVAEAQNSVSFPKLHATYLAYALLIVACYIIYSQYLAMTCICITLWIHWFPMIYQSHVTCSATNSTVCRRRGDWSGGKFCYSSVFHHNLARKQWVDYSVVKASW